MAGFLAYAPADPAARRNGLELFPLAHVGIGTHLVPRAIRDRLPWRWLAVGCVLPDLIDKPIWALAQWLQADWPNVETARLFGHTAFFALLVVLAARIWKTRPLAALTYAIPTHLALDIVTDWGVSGGWGVWKSWLFWPFHVPRLGLLMVAVSPLEGLGYEFRAPVNMCGELIGAALLFWDWRRNRKRSQGK